MEMTTLCELAELRKDTCNPQECNSGVYVGLKHIDSGSFHLSHHGQPSEVKSSKARFYPGDVLYGKLRPYLDKSVVADREGICSTDILVLEPKNIPAWFLCGVLHTDKFIEHAKQTTHGVNHPRTSWSGIKVFETIDFTLPEQKKIAAILLKLQEAISIQDKIIQSLFDLKKSTMQHLFSKIMNDQNCNAMLFGDFSTLHRGYDLPLQDRNDGHVPIIGSNGIVGYHDEAKISGPGVVTGRSGSIGLSFYVIEDYWPLNTALYVCDFHGNDRLYTHYFFQWFDFKRYAAGVSVPTLNRNLVHQAKIKVPDIPQQKRVATAIRSIDNSIECQNQKKANLQNLFKTTLNKLMNGDIRIAELDAEALGFEAK